MAFDVADAVFVVASVGEFVPEGSDGPVLVGDVGELEPAVGDAEREPEVEAAAALSGGGAQSGHAADVLGDGGGMGVSAVDEGVGGGEVGERVVVDVGREVVVVAGESSVEAVVEVEHAGDAVEAEAVDAVFVEPEAAVGEEEAADLGLGVVEASGVPGGVVSASAMVAVEEVGAVLEADAFGGVLDGVRVDEVDDDAQSESVGVVDESLEVVGGSEEVADGEEAGDVVAEGAVEGVLHDGHELDGVVAGGGDAGEDVAPEFVEGGDFGFL